MITLVVAMGLNREIGIDNQLPWHLPKDLKHFKEITSNHPIIMGRKTYESIGKPLPNRTNIVVSRKKDWFEEGILIVGSLKEALKFAQKIDEDIFIIGGGNIFEQTMDIADQLEVTEIKTTIDADTFFPKIDEKIWMKTAETCHEKDEKNNFDFCFQTYKKAK
ncbi:dihydrofolate reductase [Chryseobacterium koreense]|uniref:Dihydrofolate reductase n=1 Tax=Chryseobacterium koreense CCUG 49689 TaxID=1304281 RepID=A0A0J7LM84_9FLAO|nr:dihydrofolate reductase [Chryseobacterium koreense]KMQ70190.1 dihydrofolate reductase [Chryseobacterium koreense CCUG 49689]MBB5334804.1 dihydrofolate reductase [Chryseobacterium koreense]